MNGLDELRYALADALFVAEGRYGTLQDDIRWDLDDDCTCGWAAIIQRVRAAVETLLADEFDDGRMRGCLAALWLADLLLAALDAAPAAREAA